MSYVSLSGFGLGQGRNHMVLSGSLLPYKEDNGTVVEPLGICSGQWGEPALSNGEILGITWVWAFGNEDGRLSKHWGCPKKENVGAKVIKMSTSW